MVMSVADMCVEINRVMYGMGKVVELAFVALYTRGHVLLEGNPGLGKTDLVRNLSHVLGLPFTRIQFTPDLLPSDITGTERPMQAANGLQMTFQPGPLFTSLLLADEINRATPKTQAAMLEAMAERQVTVLGETYPLDERDFREHVMLQNNNPVVVPPIKHRPFIVMATQNPIDHEGTYDLPEAQADRFMFKILMPIPGRSDLDSILEKISGEIPVGRKKGGSGNQHSTTSTPDPYAIVEDFRNQYNRIRAQPINPSAYQHVTNIYLATNNRMAEIERSSLSRSAWAWLEQVQEVLRYGIGPRGARDLVLGAKAYSKLFQASDYADAPSLAQVILPVLRHRVKLAYDWERALDADAIPKDADPERKMDYFVQQLATACAPSGEYHNLFTRQLRKVMTEQAC